MRLWLDPARLAARGLTASDVVTALAQQNVQIAAGQVGQAPAPKDQMFQISVRAVGRLTEAAQFDNIILKPGGNGALVRLKDVGRAELGAEDYSSVLRYNGYEAIGIGVSQLPTANALDVDKAVRQETAAALASAFRRAWSTRLRSTRRRSSATPSAKCCRRWWRPSSSSCW